VEPQEIARADMTTVESKKIAFIYSAASIASHHHHHVYWLAGLR